MSPSNPSTAVRLKNRHHDHRVHTFPSDQKKDELLDIIGNNRLTTVFQPIIDLVSGNVYAYEALCRIKGDTLFEDIESLFQAAVKNDLTFLLENCCRQKALDAAGKMNTRYPVALNICPSVLMMTDPGKKMPSLYEELFSIRDRIILELTERFFYSGL